MENKAIDKMTVQEMAQEILNNLKERKGTKAELKVSLRDCTLLRAIASDSNTAKSKNANCAIFDVSQRSELLAFKKFISKTPQTELEYYSDEEFTDLYLKANCG